MAEYLLEASHISKRLSESFALQDISINLRPQEVHVIIGQNGSGKSSLMKILSGSIAKDQGTVQLLGEEITLPNTEKAKAKGIFYVPQDIQLFEHMTVAENIFYEHFQRKFLFSSINFSKLYHETTILLESFGIYLDPTKLVRDYGLAEQHFIQILKAYISNPQIIILDEPSAAFTSFESKILHHIILTLKQKGVGIFLISHKLEDMSKIGDRVTILKDGELIDTITIDDQIDEKVICLLAGITLTSRYPKLPISKGKRILEVKGLQSSDILRDVSFSLHEHEILGITGLAGSGRTLLAHCLFGNAPYTAQTLQVFDTPVTISHPLDAIKNRIALMPENKETDSIIPCMNTTENIAFAALSRFSRTQHIHYPLLEATVRDYLDRFNILDLPHAYSKLNHYSTGPQQKMLLSKWVMKHPKILILDEPTRGVDIPCKVDMYNCMNTLAKKGVGIILISSDFDEIVGMCDRVLVLSGGKFVSEMTHNEVTKEKILQYATKKLQN